MSQDDQMGFDFGEKDLTIADEETIGKTFQGFHAKHPEVWRYFRMFALTAVEEGMTPIRPHTIMEAVRRRTSIPVDYKLIPLYAELFTTNHQELSWVFTRQS